MANGFGGSEFAQGPLKSCQGEKLCQNEGQCSVMSSCLQLYCTSVCYFHITPINNIWLILLDKLNRGRASQVYLPDKGCYC